MKTLLVIFSWLFLSSSFFEARFTELGYESICSIQTNECYFIPKTEYSKLMQAIKLLNKYSYAKSIDRIGKIN